MTERSRRQRVDEVCAAALERAESDRTAFLALACKGDERLRQEVEALLLYAGRADRFLNASIGEIAAVILPDNSVSPVGRHFGVYQIVSFVGAGGMGEVYRAHDPKLNRDVALKVRPKGLSADDEQLARFKSEAQAVAAINHPNIAHIYGLEESDGVEALVLEFVEGLTLAERVAQGPILLEEALPIARQIAEALEAAHEAGIIHRDLKPANIKVRSDGVVKVLDFGLAKALTVAGKAASGTELSHSPKITSPPMTMAGMILGTAAYMAPEQAKGGSIDARADVWAFGAVLFEMLSGRRAFEGDNPADVLGAVLQLEPPWDGLPLSIPARVRNVIQACLRKSPKDRAAHMQDVRLALDGAFETPVSDIATPPRPQHKWLWSSLTGMATVVAVAASSLVLGRVITAAPVTTRFSIVPPTGVTLATVAPRASPDGRTIAFQGITNGQSQIYLRSLDTLDAVAMPGTENARPAGFSPDGKWLAIRLADGTLRKAALAGGAPVTVGRDPGGGRDWGEKDVIIQGSADSLWSVSATAGERRKLAAVTGDELGFWDPAFLPGGRSVLYFGVKHAVSLPQIAVYSVDSGEHHFLLPGQSPKFATSGHLVFARDGSLWAVRFDLKRLLPIGDAVRVVDGVDSAADGFAVYDLARDGTLIYMPAGRAAARRSLVWVDRQGHETPLRAPSGPYECP